MLRKTLLLTLLWLNAWLVMAQTAEVTVSGFVLLGLNGAPAPGYPVMLLNGSNQLDEVTDDNGAFSFSFDAVLNDSSFIQTLDLCTGQFVSIPIFFNPQQTDYTAVVTICSGIDPPPPGCDAFFQWAQIYDEDELAVTFFDLSFTTDAPMRTWDFGDGSTSTEAQPTHVYAAPGQYVVTLTLTAGQCTSTLQQTITVLDVTNCECPDLYDPVCVATPSGGYIQYDNPCQAQCAGIDPWMYFHCDSTTFCQASFGYHPAENNSLSVVFEDYSFGGFSGLQSWSWDFGDGSTSTEPNPTHTYAEAGIYAVTLTISAGNGCSSSSAVYVFVYNGDCPCPDVWDPVCTWLPDSTLFQFSNACEAACFGYTADELTTCYISCDCPLEYYEPVCVITATGDTLQFNNPCLAQCEGHFNWFHCFDQGGCEYPWPVCVACDGSFIQFPSGCLAQEHGYGPEDFVNCDGGCLCPAIFDPVCILTHDGQVLQFSNACEAQCAGVVGQEVPCDGGGCGCPDICAPVCATDSLGNTVEFLNACLAECAGFGPDTFVECDSTGGPDCVCPEIYAPVCVQVDPNSPPIEFPNACFAECFGFGPDTFVECDSTGGPDCVCPQVYDPVCILIDDLGSTVEFPNACFAECAGFGPDTFVECDSTGGPDCVCPQVYDPVCVLSAIGTVTTFANACLAECAGFGPDSFVECDSTGGGGNPDCVCPQVYDPVCVLIDELGSTVEFPNACFAECAGFGPSTFVECDSTGGGGNGCACPEIYAPVCVQIDPNSPPIEFPNACFAECAGFGPDSFVECDSTGGGGNGCVCPEIYAPVCVLVDAIGSTVEFPNACFAECAGFGPDSFVECDSTGGGCFCPQYYDPVCVVDSNGVTLTFPNICFANCEGYTDADLIACDSTVVDQCDNCGCPDGLYEPVCVYTAAGPIVFPNACVALCHGYGESDLSDCFNTGDDCQANFYITLTDPTGLQVIFTDISQTTTPVTNWFWDFGDGTTSTEQEPVHTYAQPGLYTVTLSIAADSLCQSTVAYTLVIGDDGGVVTPNCQAMFFFTQNPDDLTEFNFADMSLGEVVRYHWNFGDGSSSEEANPTHVYQQAGIYLVTLTVVTADGCTSSATMLLTYGDDVVYDQNCLALFLPLINSDNLSVMCLNLSSQDAVSYSWDFGDGTTSNVFMPFHQYETGGSYTISLTIVTADGCTHTFAATINLATGDFTSSPTFSIISDDEEVPQAASKVSVFPNPTAESAWLTFSLPAGENYEVDILNLDGQLMGRLTGRATGATENLAVDLKSYASGLYLVRLRSAGAAHTLKVVKE